MDTDKRLIEDEEDFDSSLKKYLDSLDIDEDFRKILTQEDIAKPDSGDVKNILKQRHEQRKNVFSFAIWITCLSLGLFFFVVLLQAFMRVFFNPAFEILSGHGLEVVAVSVFGQSLGVIIIIAKSIWDDTPYKNILEKDV